MKTVFGLFWLTQSVFGAGGAEKYLLPWKNISEILEYHSCGCADSCWAAELKDKKTKKVRVRLRCDCKKLYVLRGSAKTESVYQNTCDEFICDQVNCKTELIVKEIKKLDGPTP